MQYIYHYLIPAIWVTWAMVWMISSIGIKAAKRRESIRSRLSYAAPLIAGTLLLENRHLRDGFLSHPLWPRTVYTFWTGITLMLIGLGLMVWARRVLGRNWSGTVTIKEDHELIQSGPYRWVRHPIYAGMLLMCLGTAVPVAEWRGFLVCLLVLISFVIKLRIEERWMTEVFGPAYLDYRRRVAGLVPFLW